MNPVVAINRRARSAEQKALRRQAVLDAAETYFWRWATRHFHDSTRQAKAGWLKGTSHDLYFKTREELFLTLYEQSLIRWSEVFIASLTDLMPSKAYAQVLYKTASVLMAPSCPLLIRLEHVIEHNVAIARLIKSKRVFISQVEVVAEHTSAALKLSKSVRREIVKRWASQVTGATRADQGPSLDEEELPGDVQDLIVSFSSEPLFVKNAVRIIEGIRAETAPKI